MNNIIPVMHCFDNNYVIPAGVAFYSMLENADKSYQYKLYVLHSDITQENQDLLFETIKKFSNASLEFINMNNKFENLFNKTDSKGHFSKEIYYKLIVPSIFSKYDKMIVADVDVVYLGDVAKVFNKFSLTNDYYVCGEEICDKDYMKFKNLVYKKMTKEEISKLVIGAGFMVYNLKKMREDNIQEKLLSCAKNNLKRLVLPEQDCIDLVCYPKIEFFPKDTMCEVHKFNSKKTILKNLVQLHYSTKLKPWRGKSRKADLWYEFLLKTPMFEKYLEYIEEKYPLKTKFVFSIKFPFYKKRIALVKLPV